MEHLIELDSLSSLLLVLILVDGHATVQAKMSIAMSEMHMNPKMYIDLVTNKLSGCTKVRRIKAVSYLGLRRSLQDAKDYVEKLYEEE